MRIFIVIIVVIMFLSSCSELPISTERQVQQRFEYDFNNPAHRELYEMEQDLKRVLEKAKRLERETRWME